MKTTNLILSVLFFAVLGTVLSLAINIEPIFGLLLSVVGFLPIMPFGVLGMGLTSAGTSPVGLVGEQEAPADVGFLIGGVIVPPGEEFATDVLALLEAGWLDNINQPDNVRWRMLPFEFNMESTKADDEYATSATGNTSFAVAGKTTIKMFVKSTPFVKSQLNTFNGIKWDIYGFTSNGFIIGTSEDGTKFQPQKLQNFRVEGEVLIDNVNMIPIVWTYADPGENNSRVSFIEPLKDGDFNIRDIKDVRAVKSVVTLPAITGFTIVLTSYGGVPFTGALKENVIIKKVSDGALTSLTSMTENVNVPGEYVVLATIAVDDYLIGAAPVGTAVAIQGNAGLESDLQAVTVS